MAKKKDKVFIMLSGIPLTGKSTFIKQVLPSYLMSLSEERYVISSDNIIEKMTRENNSTYNVLWSDKIKEATEIMWSNANIILENKFPLVFWDQTNLSKKKRQKILNRYQKELQDYLKVCVFFETPDYETLTLRNHVRANLTGKYISEGILNRMINNIEPPKVEEGFDIVKEIELDESSRRKGVLNVFHLINETINWNLFEERYIL